MRRDEPFRRRVLDYLHQEKLVHGNITPNNVLVRTADKVTKLADLIGMRRIGIRRVCRLNAEKLLIVRDDGALEMLAYEIQPARERSKNG